MSGDTAPRRVYSVEEVDAMGAAPAPKPKVYTPEEVDALAAAPAPAPGTPPEPIDEEAQWRPGPRVHPANAALGSSPTPMVQDGAGGFRTETDREVNRRSTNPLRSGAQEYIDRVAGMQDLAAPMAEARGIADKPENDATQAGLAGAAGGANTVMQGAFAPAAPILALPGVHKLAALGSIPGKVINAVSRGIPIPGGPGRGAPSRVLPWDAGEGGAAALEAATNLAMLKAAPATEAAAMKAVGKSPVGAAVASAARYDQGAGPVGRAAAALTERMRGPQTAAPVAALPPAVAAPTVPAWKPPVAPPEGAVAPDALYKPPMRYEGTRAPAVDIQPIREVPRPAGSPGVAEFKAERVVNEPRPGDVPVQRFMGRKAMAEAEAELARRAAQDNPLTPVERKIQDASGGYSSDVVVTEPGMVDTPVRKPPEIGFRRIGRKPPPPEPTAPQRPPEPPPPPAPPQEVARFRGSDARAQADRMAAAHRPDPLMAEQPLEVVPGDVGEWIVRKPGHEEAPAIERPVRTYEPPEPRSAEVVGTFRGASARANAQAAADAINAKRPSGGLVHEPSVEVVPGSDVGSWDVRRPGDAAAPTPVRRIGRTPPPVERPASPEPATIEPAKETVPQGAAEQPRQVPEAGKVPAEVVAPQEAPAAAPKPVADGRIGRQKPAGKQKVPPITKANIEDARAAVNRDPSARNMARLAKAQKEHAAAAKPVEATAPETIEASDIGRIVAEGEAKNKAWADEHAAGLAEIAKEALAKGDTDAVARQRIRTEVAKRGLQVATDADIAAAIAEARKAPAETPFERRMREAEEGREGGGGAPPKPREGPTLGSLGGALGPASPTKAIGALDKAWDLTVGRAVDAVSERVKKSAPFVRRVRQAFVNEELTLDPSEQLHQAKQRLRKGGGAVKYEARLAEKLAKSIDKELRRVPEADAAEGYKYLGGETDTLPATITPKAKQALDAASAAMHVRRVAMQARGIISEAVLKEYPRFVSRIMRLKENGQRIIGGSGTVSKIAREVHRMDAPGVLLDHGEKSVADLVAKLGTKTRVVTGTKSRTLVKFDTPEARDTFIEAARKEFGHRRGSTGWRDSFDALSETDRAMLHEITDPADSFAITMARANVKIAAHDFLGELQKIGGGKAANGGDWVVDLAKGEKPPPGYTKVEGHQWGPLNGKALSPDIHEYATSLTVKPPISAMGEVFREGFRSWKIARTVESWPTVVRNWLSHDYMTTQAGVSLMNPENWEFHAKAIKALAGHDEATLKWAVENGIVGNDWYATLNKERIGNALSGSETPVKTLYRWFTESPEGDLARSHDLNVAAARALGDAIPRPDTLVPGMKTVRKAASHLYSAQEDLVRLPAALKLQKAGKSINAIMEELEATTPSYHRHGAAQTYLANTPIIGPFARFTWEQSRILANNLRRHPSRAVIALYYSYLSKKAIEAAFSGDVTDEEKAAIESEFGWQAASTGRDEKGRPKVLDLRWTNPVGQLLAGPETEKYDSASKAWINYAATVLGGGVSPMIDPIVGTATGNDTRGRPVADEVTKAKYGAAGAVGEVYRRYIGRPVFGRHLDALRAAKAGVGVTPRSPVLTEEDVVRGYLLGLSMGRLDISKAEENIGDLMDAKKAAWTKTLKGRARAGATDAELDEMIKLAETDEAARAENLGKRLDTLDAARRSRPEEP